MEEKPEEAWDGVQTRTIYLTARNSDKVWEREGDQVEDKARESA